jgi:hypothetical protein
VALTALLPLGAAELDRIALADPQQARLVFARALNDFIFDSVPFNALDTGNHLPLVLWPTVETFFQDVKAGHADLQQKFLPRDSHGVPAPGWNAFSPIFANRLFVQWEHVHAFLNTILQLRALRGTFQGLDAKEALRQMRQRQRDLLKSSASLVKGELLSSRINYAFFKATAELAFPAGSLGSFVILEYKDRKFVLG